MKNNLDEMKLFFYAEIQRKFTYLTSEASSIIEFELIFGIIKDFIESKKFTLKTLCIQHVTLFNIFSHSETTLNVSKALETQNSVKNGKFGDFTFTLLTSSHR